MDINNHPKRAPRQHHVRYELEEAAIIDELLASAPSDSVKHSFKHTIPPYHSFKGYAVLDLHYIKNPSANVNEIAYDVLAVEKNENSLKCRCMLFHYP